MSRTPGADPSPEPAPPAGQQEDLPTRRGRPRDATRDAVILEAALDVFAEHGYEGMTIGMVATRARAGKATMYRRWRSKADLVLDAVHHLDRADVPDGPPPDTGTLRGDLVAMIRDLTADQDTRRMQVVTRLVAMQTTTPQLTEAVTAVVVRPWVEVNRTVLQRAMDRGQVRPDVDIALLAQVLPSLATHRVVVERAVLDREHLERLIDQVLLPALGAART